MEATKALSYEVTDERYLEMTEYLSSEGGYWLREDKWYIESEAFSQAGLNAGKYKKGILADFTSYAKEQMKVEMKYYLLYSMKNKWLLPFNVFNVMTTAIRLLGEVLVQSDRYHSFCELESDIISIPDTIVMPSTLARYQRLARQVSKFINDMYDEREETEKDVWQISRIPGAKQSAACRRMNHTLSFVELPEYYKDTIKQYMGATRS